jgi:glycosyltransferase involved in cell wall biosynthesis
MMPLVLARRPDTYLVVTHRGPWAARLQQFARELGVDHRVLFVGPVPVNDVKYFLNACDLLVSAHDHSNLSIPVLEALQCGRPVVTLADGSTDGVLIDDVNSIVVERQDLVRRMAERVVEVLESPELWQRLSASAREWAGRHLVSWEDFAAREAREVRACLESSPGRRLETVGCVS